MKRWMPHIHCGESIDACVLDEEDEGREGYYFQVCWLGWMISLSVTSLRWERQWFLRHTDNLTEQAQSSEAP